jgi:hypothetical protein
MLATKHIPKALEAIKIKLLIKAIIYISIYALFLHFYLIKKNL